ncbi:hypothetical protein [Actinomadura sp. GTD37]|uniref:hypothetical protein n=1 Tax=Actinomadura sp. GTD37 TaxID=1778030 RepID=UPI0035C26D15
MDGEALADDEHQRFAHYQQVLARVSAGNEASLVSAVLRDEDVTMAQSAVVSHLDRRADELLTDPRFPDWADAMAPVIAPREFLTRRLREWTLLRSVSADDGWSAEDVLAASDWLQRKIVRTATSPAALRLLASKGRTRRVRSTASRQLLRQHP